MKAFHLVGPAPYATNCFVLITRQGSGIVVDPAPAAAQIDRLLAENDARLTHILLTHGHFDHVYSLQALRDAWHCKVYMDPADAKGSEQLPVNFSTEPYVENTPLAVDELEFTAWHTPGHTPGSWLLCCGDLLFCGDTLFAGSVGRTDLVGGSPAAQKESLAKIKALPLPDETQVLPGHGVFSTLGREKAQNPYLAF